MQLYPNFYSSFASSIHAQFASFTGLYPVRDYKSFTSRRVPVRSMFEVLHERGYATSIFTSTRLNYTGFRDFLQGRNVDEMFDADNMPGASATNSVSWGLKEEETLAAMQQQIRKYAATRQKFFLTYIPVAPHNPFDGTPHRFCKFQSREMNDFTPSYRNELLYMDWVIASVLDELQRTGVLDNTLVVMTGDHGEMLGAGGGPIGHGWALTPQLANVPLIIMDPARRGGRINEAVGSQVDLLPTILDALQIGLPPHELYQGSSLYATNALADRVIWLNAFRQYGVLQGRHFVSGDRESKGFGSDASGSMFLMENQGARTIFKPVQTDPVPQYSIADFDAFQENLLRNYSVYRELMHPGTGSQELAAKR